MVGTTGALGVTTAIPGARALGLQSDYEEELQLGTTRTELDDCILVAALPFLGHVAGLDPVFEHALRRLYDVDVES
jgi:hypothetical protein